MDGTAVINRIATRSAGFASVYTSSGIAGTLKQPIWNDPQISVNISVWATLQTLENFVYTTLHKTYLGRKDMWFENIDGPTMVLWWVDAGHEPNLDEALDRLASLKTEGPNARAFDWSYARNLHMQ